jgi:hypothetical protein
MMADNTFGDNNQVKRELNWPLIKQKALSNKENN